MYGPYTPRHFISLFAILALCFFLPGCSSAPQEEDEEELMVGGPPRDDDDSLFRHALPAEAVPADPSGQIGVPDATEEPQTFEETPDDEPDEPKTVEETPKPTAEEPEFPDEEEVAPPPDLPDDKIACYSCIRICPIDDDGIAQCGDGPGDLICGWGSHDDGDQARQMARAQCDASLDLARHMPNYSGIEGNCPPATCR